MEYYTNSRDDEEDSKVGDDGQFVALASVSGEDEIYLELNDKEKKKPKEGRKKKQKQHKSKQAQLLKDELNPAIEKKGSNDSAQFQRRTCGDMFSQIFGINPSDVVVKVLVRKKNCTSYVTIVLVKPRLKLLDLTKNLKM